MLHIIRTGLSVLPNRIHPRFLDDNPSKHLDSHFCGDCYRVRRLLPSMHNLHYPYLCSGSVCLIEDTCPCCVCLMSSAYLSNISSYMRNSGTYPATNIPPYLSQAWIFPSSFFTRIYASPSSIGGQDSLDINIHTLRAALRFHTECVCK